MQLDFIFVNLRHLKTMQGGGTNTITVPEFGEKKGKAKSRWPNFKASIISYGQPISYKKSDTLKLNVKKKKKRMIPGGINNVKKQKRHFYLLIERN